MSGPEAYVPASDGTTLERSRADVLEAARPLPPDQDVVIEELSDDEDRRFTVGFYPSQRVVGLCVCQCHSSCPVTIRREVMPLRAWRGLCTCPGVEDYLAGRGELDWDQAVVPDYGEHEAQQRRNWLERREALDVVRAGAAGMSREQIRDMYVAELRARGLEVPPDALLNAQAALIAGDYGLAGRALTGLGRLIARKVRRAD